MPDREKVMRGLECCYNNNCGACPYSVIKKCQHKLHEDALDLLKEQEPVKPYHLHNAYFSTNITNVRFEHQCTNCSSYLLPNWNASPNEAQRKGAAWDERTEV